MKRKEPDSRSTNTQSPTKRCNFSPTPTTSSNLKKSLRPDLFAPETLKSFSNDYANSSPYPHAVVRSLIEDSLLRTVRKEITTHVHFTLKETDIYRIHQSGDLANLSRLDAESLAHLPSLVQLRDALYSDEFRTWISGVTGAGKLSGTKTDMAVNVYTPGSYLLCHDDVIGSRRVSYILYLTDPDAPWKPEWGGGLRLHATEVKKNEKGEEVKVPLPDHSLNIPPSFGQLSFFAVRPGESYHDVEEVYHSKEKGENSRRTRMAISGWYHIPQKGEDGYEKGAEEAQAQKSSLAQLKGAADEFDEPAATFSPFGSSGVTSSRLNDKKAEVGDSENILTTEDLEFLLPYIAPSFLTPEMTEKLAAAFGEESFVQLEGFLRNKFAKELKKDIEEMDGKESKEAKMKTWRKARPPHKHRYVFAQNPPPKDPISNLLSRVLTSKPFQKWLALITGTLPSSLLQQNIISRRFRKGHDYALASAYQGDQPQLEFTIGLTPSIGWEETEDEPPHQNGNAKPNGHVNTEEATVENGAVQVDTTSRIEFGGEEVYMAGDDDDEEDDAASTHSKSLPQVGKKAAHDPAVYKAANPDEEEDGGILFTNAPSWNTFSLVLRDKGTLRFVKYVSAAAKGDRWDVKGEVRLSEDAFDGEGGSDGDGEEEGEEEDESDFDEGDKDEGSDT